MKRASLPGRRFHPHSPTHTRNSSFHDGQANSRSGIRVRRVQPFKDLEDALLVLRSDSDSLVAHAHENILAVTMRLHDHVWSLALGIELKPVVDQIEQDLR